MWVQILSISSILLSIFILFNVLRTSDFPDYFQYKSEYHMGCFSTDNPLNHSSQMKQYLANIQTKSNQFFANQQSFALSTRKDLKQVSIGVARDFERYLSQYYQIKTKSIYEQNFYRSLELAQQKFQSKKQLLLQKYDKNECLLSWNNLTLSRQKYQDLKKLLRQKMQLKQQHERKVSYLILDHNYADSQQYQRNISEQINGLNSKLQQINGKKIQILTKKTPLQSYIVTNQTKLQVDLNLLDQCIKNIKIINFCNQLNEQLSTIKLTFTKQNIQTKIQRKKFIIDTFHNAIRNAQKLGDRDLVQMNKKSLEQNQQQLTLLEARIQDFKTFQESYCSKCSDSKIIELNQSIANTRRIIAQHRSQYNILLDNEQALNREVAQISVKTQRLQQERDIYINSNICISPQCQQKRSLDLKQLGKVLTEMKRDVIDYKFILQQHRLKHQQKQADMNDWSVSLAQIVDCLYDKQYYQALKQRKPQHSENEIMKIRNVRQKLVKNLQALAP